jgi:hypothetical protein
VNWWITRDGDPQFLEMFKRHYSNRKYADKRVVKLFGGPGEKVALRTNPCTAIFLWRKFIDASGEAGINCAIFRNESKLQSSQLIREACAVAWTIWPNSRLYTYIDPTKIRSTNPGYCFFIAGWRKCAHKTKSGKLIYELNEVPHAK